MWWKTNEHSFWRLARLAKNVVFVPAKSVLSERLFSSIGYIVNEWMYLMDKNIVNNRHSSLDPHTVKYPNSVFLSLATLTHHLRTHPLLLPLPLISQSSPLPQNPKSTRSSPAVQTSNVTQIRSQPGFLKSAHQFLFPQSPILSTFRSSPASFTPLSRNPLSHHCLRNQHWIKN